MKNSHLAYGGSHHCYFEATEGSIVRAIANALFRFRPVQPLPKFSI
jgi:hypothetical protein